MKTLLLKSMAVVALALPLTAATAPKPKPPVPTYGGYAKGYKFTLPVRTVISSAIRNGVTSDVPVPAGVPKFKVGQQVTYTIGPKGELTGTGFKIPYVTGSGSITGNAYTMATKANFQPTAANLFKKSDGSPYGVTMEFFLVKVTKFVPTVTTVIYTLGGV